MFSNFIGIPFYRATYTQSVNGIDPALLFYQAPSQDDFNSEFLKLENPYLMGFCFRNCFNYRQTVILISPKFTVNRVDIFVFLLKVVNFCLYDYVILK
jgi:hypothetical protein